MDYEKMWNELKETLDIDSENNGLPIHDRMVFINILMRMGSINAQHTTLYIRQQQSTRP